VRIRPFRIPYSVSLPGLLVKVNVVPPDNDTLGGAYGAWAYDPKEGLAVILINGKKPLKVQRYSLLHELQHVLVDYLDQAIENHPHIFALARDIKRRKKNRRGRRKGKRIK
jgi:Zn-dependent peptidase ImmA (M78 family)